MEEQFKTYEVRHQQWVIQANMLRTICQTAIWWDACAEIYGWDIVNNIFIVVEDGMCASDEPAWLVSKYKMSKPFTIEEIREALEKNKGKHIGNRGDADALIFQERVTLDHKDMMHIRTEHLAPEFYGPEYIKEKLTEEEQRIVDGWNFRAEQVEKDINEIIRREETGDIKRY